MKLAIDSLVHACIVPKGPAAGNKHRVEVRAIDIEMETCCEVCGEPLAPSLKNIIAHIYAELTL